MDTQKYKLTLPDDYLPSLDSVTSSLKGKAVIVRFDRKAKQKTVEKELTEDQARAFADGGLVVEPVTKPKAKAETKAEKKDKE
jgi:hypothetical protein